MRHDSADVTPRPLGERLPNRELFPGREDARWVIDRRRLDDNYRRRHSALGCRIPVAPAAD